MSSPDLHPIGADVEPHHSGRAASSSRPVHPVRAVRAEQNYMPGLESNERASRPARSAWRIGRQAFPCIGDAKGLATRAQQEQRGPFRECVIDMRTGAARMDDRDPIPRGRGAIRGAGRPFFNELG